MPVQECQSVRRRLINWQFYETSVFTLSSSQVFMWVANADMACVSLDEVHGSGVARGVL